jgi:group II intron reverse transcriptase/maturase
LLRRTADPRFLRLAWDRLAAGDGQAPGLDGLRFSDLESHEVWRLVRTLSKAILDDTYRPGPDREVRIPKASGTGTRTLSIPSVIDRVVQRAVVQTVQPFLDPTFDDHCFGFRPGAHANAALAAAERPAVGGGLWVWLAEDLKDAFTTVPQRRLLDVLRVRVPDDRMMRLFERLVRTKTGRGLRQGGNLSPLLLNVYLTHFLDRRWRRLHPDVPLIRWADDLLLLCRTRDAARQAYQGLTRLLTPAGMALKATPEQATHDLANGGRVDWLGYQFGKDAEGLKVSTTEKAWKSLRENLELAHTKAGSPIQAIRTIEGWIDAMGPCFATTDVDQVHTRIGSLSRQLAFEETPSRGELLRKLQRAHRRWLRSRQAGEGQGELPAAPPSGAAPAPTTGAGLAS